MKYKLFGFTAAVLVCFAVGFAYAAQLSKAVLVCDGNWLQGNHARLTVYSNGHAVVPTREGNKTFDFKADIGRLLVKGDFNGLINQGQATARDEEGNKTTVDFSSGGTDYKGAQRLKIEMAGIALELNSCQLSISPKVERIEDLLN